MKFDRFDTFAILGMGRSGIAAAKLLVLGGKNVIATDSRTDLQLDLDGVELRLGGHDVSGAQIAIASPGIPPSAEVFQSLEIPMVSEIELAYELSKTPFIGITGTDGKTTTTELITHIFCHSGFDAVAAGNIGTPLCEVVDQERDVIVAEVSAFQLWSIQDFRCRVSVFTNIAEDHVDYFGSFEEYAEAKHRLVANTKSDDVGVFNLSDPYIARWAKEFGGIVFSYGETKPDYGSMRMWIDSGDIKIDGEHFMSIVDIPLVGTHNAMNVMASTLACLAEGISETQIISAVKTFTPAPHRLQPLGEHGNVIWFDDSKATNAHAAIAGLRNLSKGYVVIAGGVDKGLDLGPLSELLTANAKSVVLIGEIRERLSDELKSIREDVDVVFSDSIESAVDVAAQRAGEGGTVVLSPACSSFDMFESYADRGRKFQAAVKAFGEG